jgi:hypothetical protein
MSAFDVVMLKRDAAGELAVPADGRWTPALREACVSGFLAARRIR